MSTQQSTLPPVKHNNWLTIGAVVVGLCVVCIVVGMISNAISALTPKPTADVNAIQTSAVLTAWANVTQTALLSHPATTPIESPTYAPTNTPIPPTANPNLVEPGTYLVGKDIKSGLYEGQAGTNSCYWARLKDTSGTVDSILANDNSNGQYYIRVKATDYALQTDCELLLLTSLPIPSAHMPTNIDTGMYLVGIDIQPGTYKGQAGTDSCYWARLKDVEGGTSSIIANDNSTGQFYIQVGKSDFALSVGCPVEFVGK